MNPTSSIQQPFDTLPPEAESTFEGHRSFGYDLGTALADLVDNSLTAHAKHVWLDFEWSGSSSTIAVTDDGEGLTEHELVAAMRLGSRNPREERAGHDLGRFGLGLKTASLSQCRRFTVRSRRAGEEAATRCWDLDVIHATKEWRLLRSADADAEPCFRRLTELPKGTAVVWQHLDRIAVGTRTNNDVDHQHFLRGIAEVRTHLGMVFHRLIHVPQRGRGVSLIVNGHPVNPWDPFLEDVPATYALAPTALPFGNAKVILQPYVLPHLSKLPTHRHATAAGPHGWNSHQGFYIYRNKRLIVAGGWLGFWQPTDLYRLARIRIDLPNCLDDQWQIDVTKSQAVPPPSLRAELRLIGERTRQEARRIYTHRGAALTPRAEIPRTFLWEPKARHDKTFYRLNRAHPLLQRAFAASSDPPTLKALLRLIEETIPLQHITLENSEKPDSQPRPFEGEEEYAREVMQAAFQSLRASGYAPREALTRLRTLWPFELFPELLQAFEEKVT